MVSQARLQEAREPDSRWTTTNASEQGVAPDTSRKPVSRTSPAVSVNGMDRVIATFGEDVAQTTAVQAFQNIAKEWQMTDREAAGLLNLRPEVWVSGKWTAQLSRDQIMRIVAIMGIHVALHQYFGARIANEWAHRDNSNGLFGGQKPILVMVSGGLPLMKRILDYVDGLRGRE